MRTNALYRNYRYSSDNNFKMKLCPRSMLQYTILREKNELYCNVICNLFNSKSKKSIASLGRYLCFALPCGNIYIYIFKFNVHDTTNIVWYSTKISAVGSNFIVLTGFRISWRQHSFSQRATHSVENLAQSESIRPRFVLPSIVQWQVFGFRK